MKYLMYMIGGKKGTLQGSYEKKAEKLSTYPRTRAIKKALQPAGDEIKHEGSISIPAEPAGWKVFPWMAVLPARSKEGFPGGQGFHAAAPSDWADVGKERDLGQEAAQQLLRV